MYIIDFPNFASHQNKYWWYWRRSKKR